MDNMDIDSPPEASTNNIFNPRDRIMRRLAQLGVREEYLRRRYPGIVAFHMDNPSRIPELVSAIFPSDDEIAEVVQESKSGSKKAQNPTTKHHFRECMVWLQWLMFLGEPSIALKKLSMMSAGRGVCGAVWGNNDIAYRCRTCEHDPTCAICVPCFQNGNHKDHDYSIIYTGGGCCDCGDVTAWKREGFCSKHKGAEQIQPLPEEYANSVGPVLDALFICWKNKLASAETFYRENSTASNRIVLRKKVANELTFVVVEMLLDFCKHSESLLSFISRKMISLVGLLEILVRAERFLSEGVARKLSEMLLKLLGEPIFKYEFGKVFLSYYPSVVREAIKEGGDNFLKKYPLLSTFSVQILTVPTLTPRLVKEMNLLTMLLGCLEDIFIHCAGEDGRLQVTMWGNLYETSIRVVEDIRFVMSHAIVPKYVIREQSDIVRTWMRLLSYLQGMSPLKRETDLHIEEENENINLLFVLDHSVANIHSLLVDGAFSTGELTDGDIFCGLNKHDMNDEDSIRHAKVGRLSQESSACDVSGRSNSYVSLVQVSEAMSDSVHHPSVPFSVTWLMHECLRAIDIWLRVDHISGDLSLPNNGSSIGNISALKKTFLKFRRSRSIFGGFTSSDEDQIRQCFPPGVSGSWMSKDAEITKSVGQECKSMISREVDSAKSNEFLMEGNSSMESEVFRILSSSDWQDITYDVSSQYVSVHIPMHRLLSLLLQKALRRCYGESELLSTINASTPTSLSSMYDDFFGWVLGGCHPCGFSAFVMEHPLRNRVFCAEVHAGMWRKNGDAVILSSEWYRSVRWSEQGLELDLFLLQCCAAMAPADPYVSRIVERFGLSDYLSLNSERSSKYEPVLVQEMLTLIIQIIQERRFSGLTPDENLKRELIHKLSIGDATRSQLVKSLPRDLSKYDRLQEILDTIAVYSNPSGFTQGMYSLHWMYWKELDLYHPRWNSRDLQVAEERYMRHCSVSASITQLPTWIKIYPPLKGVAKIATCKVVLKIIRAVLFYAVFSNKLIEARAPDAVLIMALHLLSLGLDICSQQRDLSGMPLLDGDSVPMLAFAVEEIHEGLNYGAGIQSLLSLLVSLMRMHKRESLENFSQSDGCNTSSLIESLLKKFAELDSGCMAKLQELAPEFAIYLSQPSTSSEVHSVGSASESEKRKAKARERQAAMLAKMKAEQSKFLLSINSTSDSDQILELEESNTGDEQGLKDPEQDVCSLCHDPNSRIPVSFMILLQKSRLLSLTDRGPPAWNQTRDKEQVFLNTNKVAEKVGITSSSSALEVDFSSQLSRLVQNAVNKFAVHAQRGEIIDFLEFVRAQFPSLRNIQVPSPLKDGNDKTACTFETLEQDLYTSIRNGLKDNLLVSSCGLENAEFSAHDVHLGSDRDVSSVLLGKYIAALSRETTEHPSSSENNFDEISRTASPYQASAYEKFGPADCDGVYLSSCGHAVHQGCLDRYLSSLKERFIRRLAFEGGHIVDPDQGEFLCPVCRRLANSVLPSLPGHFGRLRKEPMVSTVCSTDALQHFSTLSGRNDSLWLPQALSLLQSAADIIQKGDIWETFSLQRNERMKENLDSMCSLLFKMYFPSRQDKFLQSTRANKSIIMWNTLKYSLVSMEIAGRSDRNSATPNYSLNALHREFKSSSGFVLSLLLKIVQSLRSKNSLHVLQRFRGVQLFAKSICSGVSAEHASGTCGLKGNMSAILKQVEKELPYPDMQFWSQATDPILIHDAFSSLMWVLFCLPRPFLSCEESLLSLIHVFYVVCVAQAIVAYNRSHLRNDREAGFCDCLVTDISEVLEESGWIQQYFVSNYDDFSSDPMVLIRRLSFPYLRRCQLLWKLLSTSVSEPFCNMDYAINRSSPDTDVAVDPMDVDLVELNEVQKLEQFFKIPAINVVLKDQAIRSTVMKWLCHIQKEYEPFGFQHVLYSTPAFPFRLMQLPHVYQDLLERYIKQRCADCKSVFEEPALCLLCGKLCSPHRKPCCRESGCQTHAMACGAGTGVFLLIKRTTILLQRCARQAPWPSPYLDAFGEEDIEMHRGKPLYLNEERYAALTYMVASHGLDRSSKVLGQTTIGAFFLV